MPWIRACARHSTGRKGSIPVCVVRVVETYWVLATRKIIISMHAKCGMRNGCSSPRSPALIPSQPDPWARNLMRTKSCLLHILRTLASWRYQWAIRRAVSTAVASSRLSCRFVRRRSNENKKKTKQHNKHWRRGAGYLESERA